MCVSLGPITRRTQGCGLRLLNIYELTEPVSNQKVTKKAPIRLVFEGNLHLEVCFCFLIALYIINIDVFYYNILYSSRFLLKNSKKMELKHLT